MIEERGWSVPEREDWCGKEVGGSAAQEAVRWRQRGSEGAGRLGERRGDDSAARRAPAGRLGERRGGDSAARRAPGGSESGEEATARL